MSKDDKNWWDWINGDTKLETLMNLDEIDKMGIEKVKIIRSKKGSGHSRPGSYYVKGWPQMTASYDKLWQMAQDLPTW